MPRKPRQPTPLDYSILRNCLETIAATCIASGYGTRRLGGTEESVKLIEAALKATPGAGKASERKG